MLMVCILLWLIELVLQDVINVLVIDCFEVDFEFDVLLVVYYGQLIGMINWYSMIDCFVWFFCKELFGCKSCEMFMDYVLFVVDQYVIIQELVMMLVVVLKYYLFDGFIVIGYGCYFGVGSSYDLMVMIIEMQISVVCYVNLLI